jgi:hypothetical protein
MREQPSSVSHVAGHVEAGMERVDLSASWGQAAPPPGQSARRFLYGLILFYAFAGFVPAVRSIDQPLAEL